MRYFHLMQNTPSLSELTNAWAYFSSDLDLDTVFETEVL